MESLEQDLARAGQENRAQSARAASLERQLDAGGGGSGRRRGSAGGGDDRCEATEGVATADIMALKAKTTHLVERWRQEKSARLKAERETQKVAGKVRVHVHGSGSRGARAACMRFGCLRVWLIYDVFGSRHEDDCWGRESCNKFGGWLAEGEGRECDTFRYS